MPARDVTRRMFGWQPRPWQQTSLVMAESLIEFGLVWECDFQRATGCYEKKQKFQFFPSDIIHFRL